jgi:hypothetical protein
MPCESHLPWATLALINHGQKGDTGMFARLFESTEKRGADQLELQRLQAKYGAQLVDVLKQRAGQRGISSRNKRHWQRILKKAKRGVHI